MDILKAMYDKDKFEPFDLSSFSKWEHLQLVIGDLKEGSLHLTYLNKAMEHYKTQSKDKTSSDYISRVTNIKIYEWLHELFRILDAGRSGKANQIKLDKNPRKLSPKKIIKPAPRVDSLTHAWNKVLNSLGFIEIFHLKNKGQLTW